MEVFEENMTAKIMKQLLSNTLLQTAEKHFPQNGLAVTAWSLLHDNDKKFKSEVVQKWIHDNGVDVMEWASYSPDLNPIEHVWAYLKREVEKMNPKGKDELKAAIHKCWKSIPVDFCAKVVASMPKRMKLCIARKGGKTGY
jgi:hypothetical protein